MWPSGNDLFNQSHWKQKRTFKIWIAWHSGSGIAPMARERGPISFPLLQTVELRSFLWCLRITGWLRMPVASELSKLLLARDYASFMLGFNGMGSGEVLSHPVILCCSIPRSATMRTSSRKIVKKWERFTHAALSCHYILSALTGCYRRLHF